MKLDYDVVLPSAREKKMSTSRKLIEEFLKSGQKVAEVIEFEDCGKNQRSVYYVYRGVLERMDLEGKVKIITKCGRLFLVRSQGGRK